MFASSVERENWDFNLYFDLNIELEGALVELPTLTSKSTG